MKSCTSGTSSGDVCGTIAGLQCPSNYTCVTDPTVADDDGICCPKTGKCRVKQRGGLRFLPLRIRSLFHIESTLIQRNNVELTMIQS